MRDFMMQDECDCCGGTPEYGKFRCAKCQDHMDDWLGNVQDKRTFEDFRNEMLSERLKTQ